MYHLVYHVSLEVTVTQVAWLKAQACVLLVITAL